MTLNNRFGAPYTLDIYYGEHGIGLKIKKKAGNVPLRNNLMSDGTPFIFGRNNYLVIQYFEDLPGVKKIMADRILNRLVREEIERYRSLTEK
jgi:hypothetical protein